MSDSYGYTPEQWRELIKKGIKRGPKPRPKSKGEETMARDLAALNIPFEREVAFYPKRRWRFDFILTGTKIAIEVEGGVWNNGRHSRGKGFEEDCEKYNHAAIEHWRVLRFTTHQVTSGQAIAFIKRIKSLWRPE